ncbi:GH35 family beta-galactosidase [Viscerimonas tarda]
MKTKTRTAIAALLLCVCAAYSQSLPHIVENERGVKQFIVGGKPFIFMGGELNNSSSSNLEYLAPRMAKAKEWNFNSVIATVSWELFEQEEGKFDYSLVKGIIDQARQNDLKLILIWFGTWKNASSTYVPGWVKTDLERFPRMQTRHGDNSAALSAFGQNALQADIKAFTALMRYIKSYDAKEQTVLMMQVENETGVQGTARDKNDLAEAAFKQAVPEVLLNYLDAHKDELVPEMKQMLQSSTRRQGATWQEVFGYGADECFMAWYISSFVNEVAKAGKKEYDIPMYVNAWHDWSFSKDLVPDYPSGGPVSKMFDIWQVGAPAIDLIGVDVYHDDFKRLCKMYTQRGNPLFLPELSSSVRQAAYVYYALGENAMCFAPFGVDNFFSPEKMGVVAKSYRSLKGFLPFFAQYAGKGKSVGLLYTNQKSETIRMGDYNIQVEYRSERNEDKNIPEAGGLILQVGEDEFYICGTNISTSFSPAPGSKHKTDILFHDEGRFENGQWISERRLNGDERRNGLGAPTIRRMKLYRYN